MAAHKLDGHSQLEQGREGVALSGVSLHRQIWDQGEEAECEGLKPSVKEGLEAVLIKPREKLKIEDEQKTEREIDSEREIDREVDRDRGLSN